VTGVVGAAAGYGFTVAALWAANGRAFAWWEYPLGALLVLAGSGIALAVRAMAMDEGAPAAPTPSPRAR
jgi:hypothetical protein